MQNRVYSNRRFQLQLIVFLITLSLAGTTYVSAQKATVNYYSGDSLQITADQYFSSDTLPYVVLIHEQGASRGEYTSIVSRFQKMNFNCLVPDVRNGGNASYQANETAKRCRTLGLSSSFINVEKDIIASVEYAFSQTNKSIILVGAGANGSLVLHVAKDLLQVSGAIALSPGEYFGPALNIESEISGIEKPILITASQAEYVYVNRIVSGVGESYKNIFAPENDEGKRGVNALLPANPSSGDYWLSILLFIKDLN